ncbi:hypothetical protein [Vibrio vulnificus]|nr:hypothetical protein [Vibrio vulnificus]KFK50931.1 hypothetical protein JS86_24855 [Vibrio vulnificus]
MRIKHILSIVAITLTPYPSSSLAQESATVGQKSTQEKRTQKETAINDEASMELQRQKGAEQRDG